MEEAKMSLNTVMQNRFSKWLDDQIASGQLPTGEMLVHHRGRLVMRYQNLGLLAKDQNNVGEEVIYRLFSMTKPVVSMALMLLFEEGRVQLADPIWKYLGEKWKKQNMKVLDMDASAKSNTVITIPCARSITIAHLLTHTSGLSHGLSIPGMNDPIDAHYRSINLDTTNTLLLKLGKKGYSVQEFCDKLAECPLMFQPGQHWHYSYAIDLVGRIVEVVSGKKLEDFLQERIFAKLGMVDTAFVVPGNKKHRLSDLWVPPTPKFPMKAFGNKIIPNTFASGSGGLFGTASDYMRFCEMLLRGGLSESGERIISKKTLEWMTMNHLHAGSDQNAISKRKSTMRGMGFKNFANDQVQGIGFGLGFAVWEDVPNDQMIGSRGSYFWSGAASTHFWVDPKEELAVVFCTQLLMADPFQFPIMPALRAIVYGALDHENRPTSLQVSSNKMISKL